MLMFGKLLQILHIWLTVKTSKNVVKSLKTTAMENTLKKKWKIGVRFLVWKYLCAWLIVIKGGINTLIFDIFEYGTEYGTEYSAESGAKEYFVFERLQKETS